MTLTDTGPLVALVDTGDDYNTVCEAQLPILSLPLVAPWPCFTEAMHLLNRAGGGAAQDELWEFVTRGFLIIHAPSEAEQARMRELMMKFRDTPMDLADAAVVAAAEALNAVRVFSIDSDFYVYRLADGTVLEVIPGPAAPRRKRRI
jgi:predicted nucleic acid-binding protein